MKVARLAPHNLITLCETCHKAYHTGKIELKYKRGQSFKAAPFMGIMRWAFFNQVKDIYTAKGVAVQMTYGYLTKQKGITHNLQKTRATFENETEQKSLQAFLTENCNL